MTELNYQYICEKQAQEIRELKLLNKINGMVVDSAYQQIARLTADLTSVHEVHSELLDEAGDLFHALGMEQARARELDKELTFVKDRATALQASVDGLKDVLAAAKDDVVEAWGQAHMYRVKYQKAHAERGWWYRLKDYCIGVI